MHLGSLDMSAEYNRRSKVVMGYVRPEMVAGLLIFFAAIVFGATVWTAFLLYCLVGATSTLFIAWAGLASGAVIVRFGSNRGDGPGVTEDLQEQATDPLLRQGQVPNRIMNILRVPPTTRPSPLTSLHSANGCGSRKRN